MDRHTMSQLENKIGELLRFGSPSCIRQANSLMCENFENILRFALDLTEPKPKPKHTIADNFPAGGLTSTEPCMFCEDYEQLEAENAKLKTTIKEYEFQIAEWVKSGKISKKSLDRSKQDAILSVSC